MRFLLAAHGVGAILGLVPETRFLSDRSARPHDLDLAIDFELQRLLQEPERVEVLHLSFRPEGVFARRPNRHVGIAPKAPLLHVAVVDAKPDENGAQAREELCRVLCGPQIRPGDDLDERNTAAVEVEIGPPIRIGKALVQRLAGIFFQVHPHDADLDCRPIPHEGEMAVGGQRLVVLRDLIALR